MVKRLGRNSRCADTPEDIDMCLNCTLEECINCLSGGRSISSGRPRKRKDEEFIRLYESGMKRKDIVAALGVSDSTYQYYLKKYKEKNNESK